LKQKVKVRITAVRRRTMRATGAAALLRAQCVTCGREVESLTRSQAGEILEVGDQELSELIAAGLVHAMQTINGQLRICKDSLFVRGQSATA
jgi:hypothetical protein